MITPPTVFAVDWKTTLLRRADVGALKLIFRRHLALDVLADLAVGFAQFLGDVTGEQLIDLEDLQLGLDDLALRLGGGGDELAALALKPRLLAFEVGKPVHLDEVLFPKLADAVELLVDEPHFLGFGVLLGDKSGDLLLQLLDALRKLILLADPGGMPQLEQLALACHRFLHIGIVGPAE